jgi:hypothetical protein
MEQDIEILNTDFSILTEKNKRNIIEMIKFLVLTQNAIVPELLNDKVDVPVPLSWTKRKRRNDCIGKYGVYAPCINKALRRLLWVELLKLPDSVKNAPGMLGTKICVYQYGRKPNIFPVPPPQAGSWTPAALLKTSWLSIAIRLGFSLDL